ncbi:hypothetical protein ASF88_03735 [Leifsonia sp. Leaf336]|uniref:hypothetical protein n=1 Tax=Leifsonia sp. Leaf336 TaxID=1736341 RepID=UPI0006FB98DD|nr:hypothetical protein [Leifsonia sp. Leaf336]KQR53962.1 hypothetical protein ASF88_03735 [Leifsonia sp. Leaf336]
MHEQRILAQIRELEGVVHRLERVRDAVGEVDVQRLEDAGAGHWAGQRRVAFKTVFDEARSSHARISSEIGDAIGDCKSKQRALAGSINPLEHPLLSAEAYLIALN